MMVSTAYRLGGVMFLPWGLFMAILEKIALHNTHARQYNIQMARWDAIARRQRPDTLRLPCRIHADLWPYRREKKVFDPIAFRKLTQEKDSSETDAMLTPAIIGISVAYTCMTRNAEDVSF